MDCDRDGFLRYQDFVNCLSEVKMSLTHVDQASNNSRSNSQSKKVRPSLTERINTSEEFTKTFSKFDYVSSEIKRYNENQNQLHINLSKHRSQHN